MAKADTIHKNYREIEVYFTDGEKVIMRSTLERKDESNVLKLDVDYHTHPAWTQGGNYVNTRADSVAKFNDKYAGLFGKKEPTAPVEPKN